MEMQPTMVLDGMVGKMIGNYVVRHKLGEGGMGSVYFAEHPSIGKRVALKVLHTEFASQPEIVNRFFNEAKAVNDIQHPNIVDIIDFGRIPSAVPTDLSVVYFIMEYIEGTSLTDLIRREGPLPPDRAVTIALQIADALSASHRKGIVHRDLKPDNVMLVPRGREHDFVKLLDFGIAKLTGDAVSTHRTRTGIVMGTPHYMSPEQCEGRGNIDHRTDIYALGIVLYQMLTGRVPFVGDGFGEVLVQQMATPPLPPSVITPQIPEHVEFLVLKALEKRADNRYQRMDDMSLALQDPVQYVETHGGRTGFLASPVLREPAIVGSRAAMAMFAPASERATPTTFSGSAAQLSRTPPARRRMSVLVGLSLGLALALGGVVVGVVARSGDDPPIHKAVTHPAPAPEPDPRPAPKPGPPPVQPTLPPPVAIPIDKPKTANIAQGPVDSMLSGATPTIEGGIANTLPKVTPLNHHDKSTAVNQAHPASMPAPKKTGPKGDGKPSPSLSGVPRPDPRPASAKSGHDDSNSPLKDPFGRSERKGKP